MIVAFGQADTSVADDLPFTVHEKWIINYAFDCSSFGEKGNLAITVHDTSGDLVDVAVNELAAKGNDGTPVYTGQVLPRDELRVLLARHREGRTGGLGLQDHHARVRIDTIVPSCPSTPGG